MRPTGNKTALSRTHSRVGTKARHDSKCTSLLFRNRIINKWTDIYTYVAIKNRSFSKLIQKKKRCIKKLRKRKFYKHRPIFAATMIRWQSRRPARLARWHTACVRRSAARRGAARRGCGLRAVDHYRTSIYWCALSKALHPRRAPPATVKLETHECQVTRDITSNVCILLQLRIVNIIVV